MKINRARRNIIRGTLLGAGAFGLRSLVTGLPESFLRTGSVAHAQDAAKMDYLILSTSKAGDPINVNAPGTYIDGTEHNPSAALAETPLTLGTTNTTAAKPWADLSGDLRERMAFIHHHTYAVAHPEMPRVLAGYGSVSRATSNLAEEFPSLLSHFISDSLATIQTEPISVNDTSLTMEGRPLDTVKPSELQGMFNEPEDLQETMRSLRDAQLDSIYKELRSTGTPTQKSFLDRYALGRDQARQIGSQLAGILTGLPVEADDEDGARDQIIAAVALLRLNVAPVISINIPFGGDNHSDPGLAGEAAATVSGCAALQFLWEELVAAGLQDQTTFANFNVFGRSLRGTNGRSHNGEHHAMCLFGPRVHGGIAGGIQEKGKDFQAVAFDSVTGKPSAGGDVGTESSLESAMRTLGAAVGISSETLDSGISGGTVIQSVLA